MTTKQKLETRADADFAAHLGKVLLVKHVDHSEGTVYCDPPARLRVIRTTPDEIHHWCDNWLDPYWNVKEVELHPALKGLAIWVYGPSYCMNGSITQGEWEVERLTLRQRLKGWLLR